MKVILTGATGMVGEGVLIECLDNEEVTSVFYAGRKSNGILHPTNISGCCIRCLDLFTRVVVQGK